MNPMNQTTISKAGRVNRPVTSNRARAGRRPASAAVTALAAFAVAAVLVGCSANSTERHVRDEYGTREPAYPTAPTGRQASLPPDPRIDRPDPVVREPVLREPVVREPIGRPPVVREPAGEPGPVIEDAPVVREPVARDPVVPPAQPPPALPPAPNLAPPPDLGSSPRPAPTPEQPAVPAAPGPREGERRSGPTIIEEHRSKPEVIVE